MLWCGIGSWLAGLHSPFTGGYYPPTSLNHHQGLPSPTSSTDTTDPASSLQHPERVGSSSALRPPLMIKPDQDTWNTSNSFDNTFYPSLLHVCTYSLQTVRRHCYHTDKYCQHKGATQKMGRGGGGGLNRTSHRDTVGPGYNLPNRFVRALAHLLTQPSSAEPRH